MPARAVFRNKLRRMLTFGVVTLVVALLLNVYARTPFHVLQLLWGLFGVLIGAVEQFFFTGRIARAPVWAQFIMRVVIIGLIAMLIMSVVMLAGVVPEAFREAGVTTLTQLWTTRTGLMVNALIVASAVMLFMEMERMVGSRMFRRFLTGRYVHPKREDRVVMFMDLAGSTTLTEQLGDRHYFDMLNDTFDHMTGPILQSGAEVLKYIGDEVIFIWSTTGDGRDLRCLELFFDVAAAIERERSYYERTYGVVPRFRAGCHRGVVITAQIGTIKRTIDLSGDAMNTCARLAGATKELDAELVASEDLLNASPDAAQRFALGESVPLELRGKADAVRVRVVARLQRLV